MVLAFVLVLNSVKGLAAAKGGRASLAEDHAWMDGWS